MIQDQDIKLLLTFVNRVVIVDEVKVFVAKEVDFDDPHYNKVVGVEVTDLIKHTRDKELFLQEVAKQTEIEVKMSNEVKLIEYHLK
jgi:hypothetical protein